MTSTPRPCRQHRRKLSCLATKKGGLYWGEARQGCFELADGGTLLLDEIGDMPLEIQAKLLRVLQDGTFERLGSSRTLQADVRIVAATNKDLSQAVAEQRFPADLFYRIHVITLHLPPLRQRREDIPLLAWIPTLGKRLNTTTVKPKTNRRRLLPNQGTGTSVVPKPAAISRGFWARFRYWT